MANFQGARRITSLPAYPLRFHKNEAKVRKELIERGKKFVALSGVHYKRHQGMAYMKKKKSVVKVNIDGRVMIDSSVHRRINPNYPISLVRPKDYDLASDEDEDDDDQSGCGCGSDMSGDEGGGGVDDALHGLDKTIKYITKQLSNNKGNTNEISISKEAAESLEASLNSVTPTASASHESSADKGSSDEGRRDHFAGVNR